MAETQYAGLTAAERVLAAADVHMSGCDAPTIPDCAECTRKITKYRKYLSVLAEAGLLVPPGAETRRAVERRKCPACGRVTAVHHLSTTGKVCHHQGTPETSDHLGQCAGSGRVGIPLPADHTTSGDPNG